MAITNFIPQIWSARLLVAKRKTLVYGGPGIVNRDYEGEIRQSGDTVRITSISRPTIGTYVPNSTTISPEELTDAQRTLTVDQSKYFAFQVDDVDRRQARGEVMTQAMDEAAYALADVADQYIAALYTQAATTVTGVTADITAPASWATEAAKIYDDVLIPLRNELSKKNVPMAGRYVVVNPDIHGLLLRDARFIEADKSSDAGALRNGQVGRAAGFAILESNNVPSPSAGEHVVIAGVPDAITYAEQISQTEAYRPESAFSDAVKGLDLYGAKVIRPNSLATCTVTLT